jgi:hypothetical protein
MRKEPNKAQKKEKKTQSKTAEPAWRKHFKGTNLWSEFSHPPSKPI